MPSERGDQAAERARTALARAQNLAVRLAELREGQPSSEAAYERAARNADEAIDRALAAVRHSAEAHHRAAEVHRRLAAVLEKVGQLDRAAEHRRLAEVDDSHGDADDELSGGSGIG